LVPADHDVVIVPGDDGLEKAELTQRPCEAVKLVSADLAGFLGSGCRSSIGTWTFCS
jgi:hypothetical protein